MKKKINISKYLIFSLLILNNAFSYSVGLEGKKKLSDRWLEKIAQEESLKSQELSKKREALFKEEFEHIKSRFDPIDENNEDIDAFKLIGIVNKFSNDSKIIASISDRDLPIFESISSDETNIPFYIKLAKGEDGSNPILFIVIVVYKNGFANKGEFLFEPIEYEVTGKHRNFTLVVTKGADGNPEFNEVSVKQMIKG